MNLESIQVLLRGLAVVDPTDRDSVEELQVGARSILQTLAPDLAVIPVHLGDLEAEQYRTVQDIAKMYKEGRAPYWAGFAFNQLGVPLMQEISRVVDEMHRQDAKFGPSRDLNGLEWLAILGEEFGEVSKDVVDSHWAGSSARRAAKHCDAVKELIQVAAVAVQAAASLRRQYSSKPEVAIAYASSPLFCACVDPAPVRFGDIERCDNCGGVTKDFNV